jgi:hypothetical protein
MAAAPSADDEMHANGTSVSADAADPPDGFSESQRAGIIAAISLAKAATPTLPAAPIQRREQPERPETGVLHTAEAISPATTKPAPEVRPVAEKTAKDGHATLQRTGRRRTTRRRRIVPLPLTAILLVQICLSLRLVWSNTAFGDEALYLWAGHLELAHWLHGGPVPPFPTYFSGAPVIYPPLGALADSLGGLAAARILSLVFMLGTTSLLWSTTRRLFSSPAAAAFASGLFVALGPTADLGAFATYDAMAIFCMALAAWMAVRSNGRYSEAWIIGSAMVMAFGDVVKYSSLLWNPVILALVVLLAPASVGRALARGARFASYAVAILVPSLIRLGGAAYIRGVMFTTLSRQADDIPIATGVILRDAFEWIGMVLLFAILGVIISCRGDDIRTRLLCFLLASTLLLAPLHQTQIHTLTSLYKHVIFGAWFAAIPAGYGLARAAEVNRVKGWRIGTAAVVFTAVLGISQASNMFSFWPNATKLVSATSKVLPRLKGPILAPNGDAHVVDYYLRNHIGSPYRLISPDSAPASAIAEMIYATSFSMIAADIPCRPDPGECGVLEALKISGQYRITSRIRWSDHYGHGIFEIWQHQTAIHTDLKQVSGRGGAH